MMQLHKIKSNMFDRLYERVKLQIAGTSNGMLVSLRVQEVVRSTLKEW